MHSVKEGGSVFSTEASETNGNEHPVHLIKAVRTDDNETSLSQPCLKLNEKALQTILKTTDGRNISIITVVSPPACGKSLLLNFIKGSLEAKECGNRNLPKTNKSQLFNGFKFNSSKNSTSCTTGIWAWSRAFLPLGSNLAVILLDTDGLTSSEASSAIFSLSFLTSSTLIYNIEANSFDSSCFTPFSTHFKYGFACLEKDEELSEEEPPFQTLAFLFRDWSSVTTYPYGREGGKSLLNDKLATLRGRLKVETKEGLKCFQQVTPYLIQKMTGFPNSIEDMNPEFLTHLETFVKTLLDDENLLPKKIFGVEISAAEFSNFLKEYINTYNNFLSKTGKLIEEDIILEATCTTFHKNVVNKCLAKYNEIFEKRRQKLKNPNQFEIQSIHDFAARQATFLFYMEKKLADYEDACREELENSLLSILEKKMRETSLNRAKYVQTCFDNSIANFKQNLMKSSKSSPELLGQFKDTAIIEFLSNFSSEDDENTLELANSLENQLEKVINTFQQEEDSGNDGVLKNGKEHQSEKSKQLAYNKIQEVTKPKNVGQKEELAKSFKKEEENRQDKFLNLRKKFENKPSTSATSSQVRNVVSKFNDQSPFPAGSAERKELEGILGLLPINKSTTIHKNFLVEKSMSKSQIKETCLNHYETEMKTLFQGAEFIETQKLVGAHQNSQRKVLSMFEKLSKSSSDSSSAAENQSVEDLKAAVEKKFTKMKIENERQVEVAKANATNWIHECLKEYQKQIKTVAESCVNPKAYQKAHEKIKLEILTSFLNKCKYNGNKSFQKNEENRLEDEMDAAYEELEVFFRMRLNTDVVSVEELKSEVRKYYHVEMSKQIKPKISILSTKLDELHKQACKAALEQLQSKTNLKKNQQNILKSWLEESYQKYKDENDMLLNNEDGTDLAIGIDLGTTYSCAAVFLNGKVQILRNRQGQYTTPSYVTIHQGGERTVGSTAKDNAYRNPENTIFDGKRMIGRRFDDLQLQNDMNNWPFIIVEGEEGPAIEVNGSHYPPELIASYILSQLVADAEMILGVPVRKVVITVPANFNDGQRKATMDAGELAGLEVLTVLNEPTAASIAYKLERFHEDARNVLIFDLGGGTFDVAIVKTDATNIEILGVDGDTHLGGEDFDKVMMQYCAAQFKNETNIDPFKDSKSDKQEVRAGAKRRMRRLQTYCEKGKQELSFARETVISVDAFFEGMDLTVTITREKFEELVAGYLENAMGIVERALDGAKIRREDVDDIVLVGGSTCIPKVQEMLSKFFSGKPLNHTINPDQAVAYGAAVKAALMNQAKKIPNFPKIQDVTAMSIGLESWVNGKPGHFARIIPKSSKIPVENDQVFNTLIDNQNSVVIKVYQGEKIWAKDNEFLGEFILNGIPEAPAGHESVQVSMCVNETGIVSVKAVCRSNKVKREEILGVLEKKGRLSLRTKERLLNEAKISDQAVLRRCNSHTPQTAYEKVKDPIKRYTTFLRRCLPNNLLK